MDQEPETPAAPTAPAGWYADPATGNQRWWDGSAWAPAAPAPVTPAPKPATPIAPIALFALIAGIAAFLLGLIPLLGLILALGAGTLAVLALIQKKTPTWMPAVGIGLAAVAFITGVIVLIALANGARTPVAAENPATPSPNRSSTPSPKPTPVAVPNVVGKTVSEASEILISAGLRSGTSNADADWVVSAQKPAAGETVDEETTIQITAGPNFSTYEKLSKRDFAQMAKNPDQFIGRHIVMYGTVWQFDSATGPCNLLANTAYHQQTYSFDYEVNTWVEVDDCDLLDPVVEDDHVVFWATVNGAYSYDTALGGTNTAVSVTVEKVKILPALEY